MHQPVFNILTMHLGLAKTLPFPSYTSFRAVGRPADLGDILSTFSFRWLGWGVQRHYH